MCSQAHPLRLDIVDNVPVSPGGGRGQEEEAEEEAEVVEEEEDSRRRRGGMFLTRLRKLQRVYV
jgi:hypothetical protein